MVDVKERDGKNPDDLPESLRIPHLRYATIYPDHVNLVIRQDPDAQVGFRIWSATSIGYITTARRDTATSSATTTTTTQRSRRTTFLDP
jgi:hypothetical protein